MNFLLSALSSIPDLVCIVESRLSANIPNLNIALPNYLSFHRDRNHYGSSIIVYVKSHFFASKVYISSKIEFFSYLLSLIIALFQLALTTGLHPHLTIWIFYLTSSHPSIPPFFLILSF